ncbi:hypothetical protein B0T25DRAFT_586094 [Lasiosphaeria hispida]|uniref:DUF7053 domain-containing protein n=1 Tax=Lasiosphaeria hispida TaxID=260671 RepID=A0AAJ0H7Z4_9PEZI|nr:hypothetical protein B0T25DRAFT_586094 [Lasiosphaeria hispida]
MPSRKYTLTHPLPHIVPQSAIATLHDHANIITLSDVLLTFRPLPTSEQKPGSATYEITDAVSLLPCGLWDTTVSVIIEFVDVDDGVVVTRHAPMGMVILERWSVGDGELRLEAELTAGTVVLRAFGGVMEGNHGRYLEKMVGVVGGGDSVGIM